MKSRLERVVIRVAKSGRSAFMIQLLLRNLADFSSVRAGRKSPGGQPDQRSRSKFQHRALSRREGRGFSRVWPFVSNGKSGPPLFFYNHLVDLGRPTVPAPPASSAKIDGPSRDQCHFNSFARTAGLNCWRLGVGHPPGRFFSGKSTVNSRESDEPEQGDMSLFLSWLAVRTGIL